MFQEESTLQLALGGTLCGAFLLDARMLRFKELLCVEEAALVLFPRDVIEKLGDSKRRREEKGAMVDIGPEGLMSGQPNRRALLHFLLTDLVNPNMRGKGAKEEPTNHVNGVGDLNAGLVLAQRFHV